MLISFFSWIHSLTTDRENKCVSFRILHACVCHILHHYSRFNISSWLCVCVYPFHSQLWLVLTPSIRLITITTIITWAAWRRRHAATSTTRAAGIHARTPAPPPSPILTGWTLKVRHCHLLDSRSSTEEDRTVGPGHIHSSIYHLLLHSHAAAILLHSYLSFPKCY